MPSPPIVLHATPPLPPLAASDPSSLYLAAYLQLACPGRWALQTGQWSSNGGDLPYITHLSNLISPRHLSSLPGVSDPDGHLSPEDRAEALAWTAYIEGQLTDLVNHTFYSLPPNYPSTLGDAHSSDLPFPQSLYVPQRLRAIVKSRLRSVGVWGVGGVHEGDPEDETPQRMSESTVVAPGGTAAPRVWSGWRSGVESEQRRRNWGEEEIVRRAKGVLDPLARRLEKGPYLFGSRPTTPDLRLFAHLALLLCPTLPNPLLPTLLKFSYPSLIAHHDRLSSLLSFSTLPTLPPAVQPQQTWSDLLSSILPGRSTDTPAQRKEETKEEGKKEREFRRARWMWFLGAGLSMVTYVLASGLVKIELAGTEDEEDEEDDEDDEGEEEVILVDEDEEDDED